MNAMAGSFPIQELNNLKNLEMLDMSRNQFNGSFSFEGLCKFKSLVELSLRGNQFSGPLPECIGNLTNLQVLDLSFNQLSGNFQSVVSKLTSLKYLLLSGNEFEGLFSFSALANHSKLEGFLLSSGSRSQLSELRVLLLGGNELHGSIPNQLCESRNDDGVSYFYFMDVKLEAIVLQEMHYLLVLPCAFWNSSEDVEVEFAMKHRYNSYKGDIINLMAGIDLSCNELSGRIPQEIGDLHGIRSLNLSNNHLTGSIPVRFSNLRSLESLDLGNNSLNGEIPSELVMLNFLGTFNVSYNNLSGRVLDKGQFGTFDEIVTKALYTPSDRLIWLRLQGIPLNSWSSHFFQWVGNLCGTFIAVHGANLSRNKLDAARILLLIDHQVPQNRKRESPSSSCEDDDGESSNISADVGKNLSKAIGDSDHDDVNFSDGSAHDDMNFYDELAAREDEVGNHIGTGEQ
ncbi:hypothetical protein GH714_034040 [Hevea brasiliensis]|uniref:Uncharacterized protein n=1 Tax=Hevea brasiliensis TaxID=3981 RepID=A0A6A6NDI4_HEVBR|nr:hypothetical protein GH714_034040 [Hevea brasiliensis]